jgi:hypothetical protein
VSLLFLAMALMFCALKAGNFLLKSRAKELILEELTYTLVTSRGVLP